VSKRTVINAFAALVIVAAGVGASAPDCLGCDQVPTEPFAYIIADMQCNEAHRHDENEWGIQEWCEDDDHGCFVAWHYPCVCLDC